MNWKVIFHDWIFWYMLLSFLAYWLLNVFKTHILIQYLFNNYILISWYNTMKVLRILSQFLDQGNLYEKGHFMHWYLIIKIRHEIISSSHENTFVCIGWLVLLTMHVGQKILERSFQLLSKNLKVIKERSIIQHGSVCICHSSINCSARKMPPYSLSCLAMVDEY